MDWENSSKNTLKSLIQPNLFENNFNSFIGNYIQRNSQTNSITKITSSRDASTIMGNLSDYKQYYQNLFEIINQIDCQENELKEQIQSMTAEKWTQQIKIISEQLEIVKDLLEAPIELNAAKLLYLKRIKKRQKRKNKLQKIRLQKEKLSQTRSTNSTDSHSINVAPNQELLNDDEHLNKIDKFTAENYCNFLQKYNKESKKNFDLLNAIKELRTVRVRQQETLCDRASSSTAVTSTDRFNEKINELLNNWQKVLDDYESAEQFIRQNILSKKTLVEQEWEIAIFGRDSVSDTKRKTIQKNLKRNKNFNDFLDIRFRWDSCTVPSDSLYGSYIPLGFVLPNDKPTDEWATYLNE